MPALNFKKQFMPAVLDGRKTQTIRATRKHPIKAGDMLYLYTGMRTKQCLRLRVTKCTKVTPIRIVTSACSGLVQLDGEWLTPDEIKRLAKNDGFQDGSEFLDFFADNHGPNFEGQLIEWRA
jgi:uncharacterized protein YqfB (UPF0267 family)